MILISKKHLQSNFLQIVVVLVAVFCCQTALAQSSQSLSVSPTLFEMSATPLEQWQSTIRIVNPNPYELTVYVSAVNFEPKGEAGDGTLLPVLTNETDGQTLAEWIVYDHEPIVIAPEKSYDMPFTVALPKDAAPGGHFAAFMVGTLPLINDSSVTKVRTSQVVTSLFFLRVAGDVTEAGTIREFSTPKTFYQSPEVELDLRFENKGNVHLRPQGDIVITNMWGQERGIIPINHQSHFGNVLPNSTRKFSFAWKSDWSVTDMGRYTAVVTLAYGTEERQFVTSTTYFWVIPLIPVLSVLLTIFFAIYLLSWLVRRYVQKMLRASGVVTFPQSKRFNQTDDSNKKLRINVVDDVSAPPSHPIPSLVTPNDAGGNVNVPLNGTTISTRTYVMVAALVLVTTLIVVYVYHARTPQRSYEVSYPQGDTNVSVTSDEILYEQQKEEATSTAALPVTKGEVVVINSSGVGGLGATVAMVLEQSGYTVGKLDTELGAQSGRTVIVYVPESESVALSLSSLLDNALVSAAVDVTATTSPITIFVGKDMAVSE